MKIIELIECASTNDEAWARYEPNLRQPVLVVAQKQTAGRGTQGRSWHSEANGNLYASLLFFPQLKALEGLPIAAGKAVVEVCAMPELRLKWPNDIFLGDAKAGGILCESRISGEVCLGAVVGIGLNLKVAPKDVGQMTASLGRENPGLIARSWAERLISQYD